ncbi:transcriptional regulator [Methylobacterium tardum]|uniref:Transcriptional regulator n=2 Tax=Methylobacterium tardum TaxID=374432 RepID=A0AA37THW8_9HYPH|nr:transcriptional regulator [Methylobacterium tardum]
MTDNTSCSLQSPTGMAVEIVFAYVCHNPIPASELPALIVAVHEAIVATSTGATRDSTAEAEVQRPTPHQVRKSVQDDGIVSFVDGKTYKTLKRHLTAHGLTPETYRERYGLPADYPMVAQSYAARRAEIAKATRLGVPGAQGIQRRTGTGG